MNNTPTPRTDFAIKASNGRWSFVLKLCSERLERELTAAREEIKETQKHLKDANRGAEINAHALRINADKLIAVTEQRDEAREQRDRLAEALKDALYDLETSDGLMACDNEEGHSLFCLEQRSIPKARQAIQSLNQPINTMNNTTNAAKRPSGLRACADGLDTNPDKYFAQKCMRHAADRMEELESELAAVTEQRDQYKAALQSADNHNHEIATKLEIVTEQRDELLRYNETFRQDTLICADCDAISIKEYKQAIEQRDRLAEAIMTHRAKAFPLTGEEFDQELWQALQSLNQN